MNLLVLNRERFNELYNCSYDVDVIPPESRINVPRGLFQFTVTGLLEIMYVPCLWVIFRRESMRNNSCFRMMLVLGVYETLGMIVSGMATGYYYCVGAVFCTHPISMTIAGACGLAFWYGEMLISIVLAVNRCAIIYCPFFANALFKGRRTDVWITSGAAVAFSLAFFGPFYTFSSAKHGWYFYPHVGYLHVMEPFFDNVVHRVFNLIASVGLFVIYAVFGAAISLQLTLGHYTTIRPIVGRHRRLDASHHSIAASKSTIAPTATATTGCGHSGGRRRQQQRQRSTKQSASSQAAEIRTFIQILVNSVLGAIASFGFILQAVYQLQPLLTYLISLSLVIYQGSSPVLYLCLNRTIRREVLALFTMKRCIAVTSTDSINSVTQHNSRGPISAYKSHP